MKNKSTIIIQSLKKNWSIKGKWMTWNTCLGSKGQHSLKSDSWGEQPRHHFDCCQWDQMRAGCVEYMVMNAANLSAFSAVKLFSMNVKSFQLLFTCFSPVFSLSLPSHFYLFLHLYTSLLIPLIPTIEINGINSYPAITLFGRHFISTLPPQERVLHYNL